MNKGALAFSALHLIFVSYVAYIEGLSAPFVLPLVVIFLISNTTASRLPKEHPYPSMFGFICSSVLFAFTIIWGVCILLFSSSTSVTLIITAVTLLVCAISIKYLYSYFLPLKKENRLIKYAKILLLATVIIATFFGGIYFFYTDQNKDYAALSVDDLHKLAKKGNPKANLVLGKKYLKGEDVPENQSLAKEYILSAAKAGEADAQYLYACLNGDSSWYMTRDNPVYLKWMKLAASNGHIDAFERLALYYRFDESHYIKLEDGRYKPDHRLKLEKNANAYIYANIHYALDPRPDWHPRPYSVKVIDNESTRHMYKESLPEFILKEAQDFSVELLGKVRAGEVSGNLPEYKLKPSAIYGY